MLNKAKTMRGYKLDCLDGEIGKVKEFYFDDRYWAIRYLVADTGNWFTGRQVLISPYALVSGDKEEDTITVNLTKKQIEETSLDIDEPVSRQFEETYYGYYGWPVYWEGPYMWGSYHNIVRERKKWKTAAMEEKAWDPNLLSTSGVGGHNIQATDGEIGHIEDFIIDDEMWAIRYLVIDTKNWWPGKKVLVSTQWIDRISWSPSKIFVELSKDTIKKSPEYTDGSLINLDYRQYETGLHQYYKRNGYWVNEAETT